MFKTTASTTVSYLTWLSTAADLSPPFDYFDFANTYEDETQRRVNRWYENAIKQALNEAVGDKKYLIATSLNNFNVINYFIKSVFKT